MLDAATPGRAALQLRGLEPGPRRQPTLGGPDFHAYVLRPTGTANEYSRRVRQWPADDAGPGRRRRERDWRPSRSRTSLSRRVTGWRSTARASRSTTAPARTWSLPVAAGPCRTAWSPSVGRTSLPTSNPRTYSFAASVVGPDQTTVTGGIKKFVDPLPSLDVAVPDTTTYPGSDYYGIGWSSTPQQMHTDLPPTTTARLRPAQRRGPGDAELPWPRHRGQKDRPVRILFKTCWGPARGAISSSPPTRP